MSPKILIFILSLASALPAAEGAGIPGALSQEWVLAAVRQSNPELREARAEVSMAESEAWMAYAWMPPRASVEWMGLAWPNPDIQASMAKRISLSQELPFPGRTLLKGRAASRSADRFRAMERMALEAKLSEAREAWFRMAGAEWTLKAIQDLLKTTNDMSRLSAKRGNFGQQDRMAQFINTMLSMEVADEESMIPMLKQQRKMAEAALNRLMGSPADRPLPPAEFDIGALLQFKAPEEAELISEAALQSPDLQQSRLQVLENEAKRDLAYSAWLPDLMLSGSMTETTMGAQESSAMLGVSLPFAWFWGTAGEAGAASSSLDQARAAFDSARLRVLENSRVALGELKAALEALDITYNKTLPRAEKGLKLASSGFQTTALGPSEILMALQDYRMIQEKLGQLIASAGKSIAMLEMARARASSTLEKSHD